MDAAALAPFVADAPQAMAMFDREMRYLAASQRWLADHGLPETPVGRSLYEGFPEFRESWKAMHRRCLAGATESAEGERFEGADGAVQRLEWQARPWRARDLSIGGIVISAKDVTVRVEAQERADGFTRNLVAERADAEARLTEERAILAATLHAMGEGIQVFDAAQRLLASNDAALQLFGLPAAFGRPGALLDDIIRFRAARGDLGDIADVDAYVAERAAQFGAGMPFTKLRSVPGGRTVESRFSPMPGGGGVYVFRDVTERTNAEAKLAEERALLAATLHNMGEGLAAFDADRRLLIANDVAVRLFDAPPELNRPGATFEEIVRFYAARVGLGAQRDRSGDVESIDPLIAARVEAFLQRKPESRMRRLPDGRTLNVRFNPTTDGGGVFVLSDVTEHADAEARLAEKTALLEATLHNMGEGIAVFDPDRRLVLRSELTAALLDSPMFELGTSYEDIARFLAARGDYGAIDVEAFVREQADRFDARKPWTRVRRRQNGRVVEVRFNPLPDGGGILLYRDITERAEYEAQIAEKTVFLETILENIGEGITVYGPDLRLRMSNTIMAQMLDAPPDLLRPGVSREDVLRYRAAQGDFGDSDVEAAIRERLARFRSQKAARRTRMVRGDRVFEAQFNPMPDGGGIYVLRDTTERERAEERIREEEAKFRSLVEQDVAGIVIVGEDGAIDYCNACFAAMVGLSPAGMVGRALLDFVPEDQRPAIGQRFRAHVGTGAPAQFAATVQAEDGRVIDLLVNVTRSTIGGRPASIAVVVDVSKRREAERRLRASEQRFRMLVEEAPDAILIWDAAFDRPVMTNKAAERLFGASREAIVADFPSRFYSPAQPDGRPVAQSYAEHRERALAGEEVRFLRRIRRPAGDERVCRTTLVRLPAEPPLYRTSFVDFTEQALAEAELAEVRRGLSARQEAERERISRELHDSLGQYLAAINIKLGLLARNAGDAAAAAGLAELAGLTSAVGSEVGRLAWELRPVALDDIGLEAAVRQLGEEWARRSGLLFEAHIALGERRAPPEVATTFYRVLQEAITNIVKHAGAKRVGVVIRASASDAVMIIEDDGKGFDPQTVAARPRPGLGLVGMRERLVAVHGDLQIETGPNAGTTLIARAPLDAGAESGRDAGVLLPWVETLLRQEEAERADALERMVADRAAALVRETAGRLQADADLMKTTALLHAIGQHSPDAIYAKDTNGRYLFANPALLAIVGKDAEIVLGHTVAEWHSDPEQAAAVMANDQRILRGGVPEIVEEVWDDARLGTRLFRSAKAPFVLADGSLAGIVCVSSDITERRAAESEAQSARVEAESANRARSMVLAAASRDLRRPLQSLTLLLSELKEQVVGRPEAAETVRMAEAAAASLSGLLTGILDLARVSKGR